MAPSRPFYRILPRTPKKHGNFFFSGLWCTTSPKLCTMFHLYKCLDLPKFELGRSPQAWEKKITVNPPPHFWVKKHPYQYRPVKNCISAPWCPILTISGAWESFWCVVSVKIVKNRWFLLSFWAIRWFLCKKMGQNGYRQLWPHFSKKKFFFFFFFCGAASPSRCR